MNPEFLSGPRRAHSFIGKVEGDRREDLVRTLRHLADAIEQGERPFMSGSPSGSYVVDYREDPTMTHNRYFDEINAWLEERRRQDAETCCPGNKHTMEGKCRAL